MSKDALNWTFGLIKVKLFWIKTGDQREKGLSTFLITEKQGVFLLYVRPHL